MSKLVNQSRLRYFATKLWEKIKSRYDNAFTEAVISPHDGEDKKITLTRVSGATADVDLTDYARLQDKNDFKQDVSADNVAIIDNSGIGTGIGSGSKDRSLGFRRLTTDTFADGYVDHIRINIPNVPANTATTSRWYVWAIKQGATDKNGDTVTKLICNNTTINVETINENSQEKKFVRIPVKDSFENGTYFIVRCATHELEIVDRIKSEYSEDVVNMNNSQPPTTPNTQIDWNAGVNSKNNTVVMQLFGRESIGSLSLKLNKTQADSSLYVKHSECTDGTDQEPKAGKVVKLGTDGKLHSSLMPKIAINEYYTVPTFNNAELAKITYENGDVVVVASGGVVSKRYLCIDKENNTRNPIDAFVELNSKDGVVTSVNALRGDINLDLVAEEARVKLDIVSGNQTVTKEIGIITIDEIDAMITALPTT